MTKKYATSVYSQKSTVSAKSGRSYLSFTNGASIKPLFNNNNNSSKETETNSISLEDTKNSIWKNFKSLIPTATPITKKKNVVLVDNSFDTSTIKSSTSSTSINLNKWKKILVSPTQYLSWNRDNNKTSPVSSLNEDNHHSLTATTTSSSSFIENNINNNLIHEKHLSISSSSSFNNNNQPIGILVNRGGETEQELAEQKKRRHERRLYLMRVQQRDNNVNSHNRHSFSSIGSVDYNNKRQVGFTDHNESSSSTLLPTPPDDSHVKIDDKLDFYNYDNNNNNNTNITTTTMDDGSWYSAPRVMFVEPSPVPRFRNEPPAPPPSPPYLNVIVQPLNLNNEDGNNHIQSLITNNNNSNDDDDIDENNNNNNNNNKENDNKNNIPTIYTTLPLSSSPDHYHHLIQKQQNILNPPPLQKSRLIFHSPLKRGQTLTFSLENAIPEDHIVIFKFLTSNSVLIPKRRKSSSLSSNHHQQQHNYGLNPSSSFISSSNNNSNNNSKKQSSIASTERYFVRPSAGKINVGQSHSDILLFLNQVPPLNPGDMLKDKILVRWAVVQRGTQVEAWVNQLKESTRRKWLEMLLEKWPDQVIERKTRISIRFV